MSEHQPAKRNLLSWIFISPAEPRLRAGWRLLLQTILMVIMGIVLTIITQPILGRIFDPNLSLFVSQIMELIIFGASIYIARRFLDKRSFASLGLKLDQTVLPDLLAGIGITFMMMGLIYILETSLGWLKFESFAWQADTIENVAVNVFAFFVVFILVGWNEELLSRGYHLQTVASGINLFWGMVISSAVFGLLHLGNPNATWVSTAGIFFAGILLAYGYIRTGQLWLSIGMHVGWNFFEGVVFGFPVSGLDIYRLIRHQIQGPEIWTGGAFGPEAGLVVLPALVIGFVLIYLYTIKRTPAIKL
jgi:hypothetical protein